MYRLLFLLFIFNTTHAQEEEIEISDKGSCSFIDLRSLKKLSSINRNQGKMAWCYAHTAADLVQYYFNSDPLSASDIAINYNSRTPATIVHALNNVKTMFNKRKTYYLEPETGFIKMALNVAFEKGFCPRDIMPDEKIVKINFTNGVYEKVDYEDAMYDLLKNIKKRLKKYDFSSFKYFYSFPNLPTTDLVQILLTQKRQRVFNKITDSLCGHERIHFPKPRIVQQIRNKKIFKNIDKQLDKKNLVAIDYGSSVLKNKKLAKKFLKGLHTSSIIGRRWDEKNNQCEYLIRDSYGNQCEKYDTTYSCDQGNVWIPQKYLKKAILLTTYLD